MLNAGRDTLSDDYNSSAFCLIANFISILDYADFNICDINASDAINLGIIWREFVDRTEVFILYIGDLCRGHRLGQQDCVGVLAWTAYDYSGMENG